MVSEWRASHGGPRRPFLLAARRRRLERARYQWRQTRRRKNHRRRQRRHRLNLSNQRGISCNRRRSKRSSLVFLSVLPRDFLKRSEHPGAQMRTKAMAIRCVAISVLLVCTAAMRALSAWFGGFAVVRPWAAAFRSLSQSSKLLLQFLELVIRELFQVDELIARAFHGAD